LRDHHHLEEMASNSDPEVEADVSEASFSNFSYLYFVIACHQQHLDFSQDLKAAKYALKIAQAIQDSTIMEKRLAENRLKTVRLQMKLSRMEVKSAERRWEEACIGVTKADHILKELVDISGGYTAVTDVNTSETDAGKTFLTHIDGSLLTCVASCSLRRLSWWPDQRLS